MAGRGGNIPTPHVLSGTESDTDERHLDIFTNHKDGVFIFLKPDFSLLILHGQKSPPMNVTLPKIRVNMFSGPWSPIG